MANPAQPVYVLDTNVFVEAHKRYYAFPLCPGYWKCLPHYFGTGQIISIDKVKDEIIPGDDLHKWVGSTCPAALFDSTATAAIVAQYTEVMKWANSNPQFTDGARADFATVADGWLVAYAKVNGRIVVTHEEYRADAKARVMLPNACKAFGVAYLDTFAMLKDLKATFDWKV